MGDLSYPNKKLSAVNNFLFEINKSEKLFRNQIATQNEKSFKDFINHSNSIKLYSDSLRELCVDNIQQTNLIDSVNDLIEMRNSLLVSYLRYRKDFYGNNPLLKQMQLLDSTISGINSKGDIVVRTNELKKTTTTFDTLEMGRQFRKNLWNKIFGRSKKDMIKLEKIEQSDITTTIDTIRIANPSINPVELKELIDSISKTQDVRRNEFLYREAKLDEFEKIFNNKITELLSEIEKDVIRQTTSTQFKAENVINQSLSRIHIIIGFFFLSTIIIVILILTDATKSNKYRLLLEKAKEDAEFQSQSKQRFLSNMSHEIRTPLQSIIGYSEQLKKLDNQNNSYINAIGDSSEHLLQVINEILDYSRINSGKFSFEQSDFIIDQTVNEVMRIIKPQAEKKNIGLCYNNEIEGGYVNGDPFRLKQILLNLLGNAVKFTEKGQITVSVSKKEIENKENYIFTIKDTGIGIPHKMQERIFEQFEQVDSPIEQRLKGTGLGLSITKALIEGQGGKISVESDVGKGSCFIFNIAYEKPIQSGIARSNIKLLDTNFQGEAWLIDDDNLILQLCSDILSKHNIKHTCFNAANVLLNRALEMTPSMILLDIRMPDISGITLCEKLRKILPDKTVIIALTAHALPDERAEILKHGFNDILMKPFRENELMSLFNVPDLKGFHNLSGLAEVKKKNGNLDTGILEQMMGGDLNELKKILKQYISETAKDVESIKLLTRQNRISETAILFHKISGRTSQIGAKDLGADLRKLEKSIDNNHQEIEDYTIEKAINDIENLITEIEIRIS